MTIECEVCKEPIEKGDLVSKVYRVKGGLFLLGLPHLVHMECSSAEQTHRD